MYQENYGTL
jgi:hypothetical protein